jgi:FkbM family methyltransferase
MDITSYSQVDQDLWVLKNFNYKKNGFFLDIGAFDGIKFSNSYILEKKFNWTGLLVEAHPESFSKMKNVRDSVCCNYAVDDNTGVVYFDTYCDTGSKISNNGIEINSITFVDLFKKYDVPNVIDYMSLDIEGNEFKSLTKFPFNDYKCLLITVEHNSYIDGGVNKNKIKEILLNNDYELVVEDVKSDGKSFEDWYKHKSLEI